jgi:hypothetical protein
LDWKSGVVYNYYFNVFGPEGAPVYGPTWTISLQLLSGEPPTSAGLTVDQLRVESTIAPLPAALPLFATGLGALGLLGWRRKRKNAAIAV